MKMTETTSRRLALPYRTDSIVDDRSFHVRSRSSAVRKRKILVPVDCEGRSRKLLKKASAFARQLRADLILLHVYEEMEYAPAHTTPGQLQELNAALHHAAEARLADFRMEFCDDAAVRSARSIVACGYLQDEVLRIAKSAGADLILLSTHGYSRMRHLFLGSKAEGILHHAACPVMIIPGGA